MSSLHRFRLSPVAGAICLLIHAHAVAQTPAAPAAPASAASAAATRSDAGVHSLTTVVISGPRASGFTSNVVGIGAFRDQAPVDVPLTNSVITREVLDAQGAQSVLDAVRNTAGVTRTQLGSATYDNISIRGVLTENRSSFRLDGSLPILGLVAIPMEDKERVEVLKGASSMYYGMVPPSGILSFEMKRAGPKPVTSFASTVNQYGGYSAHVDVGRRFGDNDKFGLRVNLVDGKEEVGLEHYKGRRNLFGAAFDFRVLDNLTVRADFERYLKKATEPAVYQISYTAPVLPVAPKNKINLGPEDAIGDARATNALMRADWGISENWNVTAEYGVAKATRSRLLPSFAYNLILPTQTPAFTTPASYSQMTGSNGVVTGAINPSQNYQNHNARLDLSGRVETGPVAHEVTFGFTRSARFQDGFNTPGPGTPRRLGTNPTVNNNPYAPVDTLSNAPYTSTSSSALSRITDRGVYAVDRIIVSQQLHVMLGIRHTNYYSANTFPIYGNVVKASENSPNISVIFKPTPNNSFYASRLAGIDAGAGVGGSYTNTGDFLPPQKTVQTELGYKHQLGGVLLQGAVFNIDKLQQSIDVSSVCGAAFDSLRLANPNLTPIVTSSGQTCGVTQNGNGKARFRGLELQASGDIDRNFGVVASAMFMNAKVLKDSTPSAPSLVNSGFVNTQGKIPGNTPKQTFSLFGEYRPDAIPGLGVNAGAYFTGRRPVTNANSAFLGGQTIYALGARYRMQIKATAATFQVNVENAANKSYWASGDSTNATTTLIGAGLPRMIRASAKFDF